MTQQQESFATCLVIATDSTLVTATAPVSDRFGWTTFIAVEEKRTLQIVDTPAGAVTTVDAMTLFQFHATLQAYGWLEAHVHEKDAWKCIITADGEPLVMNILTIQQQPSFATCSDTDAAGSSLVTATVPSADESGSATFGAVGRKRAL